MLHTPKSCHPCADPLVVVVEDENDVTSFSIFFEKKNRWGGGGVLKTRVPARTSAALRPTPGPPARGRGTKGVGLQDLVQICWLGEVVTRVSSTYHAPHGNLVSLVTVCRICRTQSLGSALWSLLSSCLLGACACCRHIRAYTPSFASKEACVPDSTRAPWSRTMI